GIRDFHVTGVQTCALPIWTPIFRTVRMKSQRYMPRLRRRVLIWCQAGKNSATIPPARLFQLNCLIPLHGACPESITCMTSTVDRSEEHTSELQSRENLVCR